VDSRQNPLRANPVDICGAGDSFSAGASLALRVTGSPAAGRALRQPGGFHHDHEERNRHGLARGGFGSPCPRRRTLAIDVGGTKFSIAAFDGERMVRRESRRTDAAGGRDWMLGQISAIARAWQSETPADRCGIGFGGPVVFQEQRIALSTHVGGWRDFHLTDWVRDLLGVPAIMDNDANAGALGEARFGAGRGYSPLFYMTLSTGIGGGIYHDGRIWRGADSYGGEIGHLTIRPDGPPCLCGWHGCFERMCCGLWLAARLRQDRRGTDARSGFRQPLRGGSCAGAEGLIMLLNPARIVIGGGIAKAGDRLFDPLRAELRRQITDWSGARIDVVARRAGRR
jgi:glucokinase